MSINKTSYTRDTETFPGAENFPVPADMAKKIARYVSNTFSPPIIAFTAAIITAFAIDSESAWLWTFIYAGLAIVLPTIYIFTLVSRGAVSDFHLNKRKERTKPLIIISLNTALVLLILLIGGAPRLILILMVTGIVQLLTLLAITLRWKISGHCTAVAGLAIYAFALFGELFLPLMLIVPLTAWSRIKLKRHTLAQTIAGATLGITTVLVILYATGTI